MNRRRTKNPFPGVTRAPDRHGTIRWRLRLGRRHLGYLPGDYGSIEFRKAYEALLKGSVVLNQEPRAPHGTFNWLIEHYMRTPKWQKLARISRKNLLNEFDRFRREHGDKKVANLRLVHVEALIAKKAATPAAANRLLKLLRRLCRFAIKKGLIKADPTFGVERYAQNPDGYHTWTDAEIEQFEAHHGIDSKAVLALRLMLWTGAARQDVCRMGRQSVRAGRIAYRRGKTGGEVDLPIADELQEVLAPLCRRGQLLFLTHGEGAPYKAETLGNWFRDQCVAAGLPQCSSHGLRKAGATRWADAGATEFEIMAFLGHKTPVEARTYTKKANRKRLADTGMAKLRSSKRERLLSNHPEKVDTNPAKELKEKGN